MMMTLSAMSSESDGDLSRNSPSRRSLRKILPSLPDMETQFTMSSKLIDPRAASPKGTHCYTPFYQEYLLLAEYNLLPKQRLPGVYAIPSSKTPLDWFGVIFVHQGLYQEGIFRFKIVIPENFPDGECPKVFFVPPVFHPMIDYRTGEVDLSKGFPKWRRNIHHLWQLLGYVRRMFYRIESENPFNSDAAHLYRTDMAGFSCKVGECVSSSRKSVYDPPPENDEHSIRFSPFDPEIHSSFLRSLKTDPISEPCNSPDKTTDTGYSWVQPGSLQPFSKLES